MITRIICPTDFTPVADNAVEYAALLCKVFAADLLLLHVEELPVTAQLISAGVILDENVHDSMKRLRELSQEVCDNFKINCTYQVAVARQGVSGAIAEQSNENTLLVMGTNGVAELYSYFFGSHAYQVAKKVPYPALIIPEGARFEGIRKMVFAIEHDFKDESLVKSIKGYLDILNPELHLVQVSDRFPEMNDKTPDAGPDRFASQKEEIRLQLGGGFKLEFNQLYSDDFPDAISEYMHDSNSDLLAITLHSKGFLSSLLGHSVAKALAITANYPILILPV
jgi:nucleotide-binding universal stress UspA family protein